MYQVVTDPPLAVLETDFIEQETTMTNHFGRNLTTTYDDLYRVDEHGGSVRIEAKFDRRALEDNTTRRLRNEVGVTEGDLRLIGLMRELIGTHGHWYDGLLAIIALDVTVTGRELYEIEDIRAQVNDWFDAEMASARSVAA